MVKKYKEELIPEAFKEVQFYLKPIEIKQEKIDYKKFDLEKVDNICNAINLFKKINNLNLMIMEMFTTNFCINLAILNTI